MSVAEPSANKPDEAIVSSANLNEAARIVFVVCDGDTAVCAELASELLNAGVQACCLPTDGCAATVEQLAAKHLNLIRQRQPVGPYRLVGIGCAGLVAHEVAFKLLGEDEQVEFLGLVDSRRPTNAPRSNAAWESGPAIDFDAYCPQSLPIRTHVFAIEHDRDELYREWSAVAGPRLAMQSLATEGASALAIAQSVTRVLREELRPATNAQVPEYSSVLPIQTGRKGTVPVYCVPGAGANVTSFMPLAAALGDDIAIVGLQPRGMDVSQVPHTSVGAAASAYVREIMRTERIHTCSLLGHSFGGWVVFEMARLLIAAGRRVESLVLIDSQPPSHKGDAPHYGRVDVLVRLIRAMEQANECSLGLARADLDQLSYEAQLLTLTERMKAAGLLPRAARVDAVRSLVRIFSVNINTSFVAEHRFPGKMLLVQADEPCAPEDLDPDDLDDDQAAQCWAQHASQLARVKSAGNHMTMLKSPNVSALASHIRTYLNRPDAHSARPARD